MASPGARETESQAGPACLHSAGMQGWGQTRLVNADPREHREGCALSGVFPSLGGTPALRRAPHIRAPRWDPHPSAPAGLTRGGRPGRGPRIPGKRWARDSDPSRSRGAAHRQEASRGGGGRLAEPCSNGAAAAAPAASHRLRYRPQPARCGRPAPAPAAGPAPAPVAPWTHSRGATQEGREQCPGPQPPRGTSGRRPDFAVRDARLRSGSSRSCLLPGRRKLCGCVCGCLCVCVPSQSS